MAETMDFHCGIGKFTNAPAAIIAGRAFITDGWTNHHKISTPALASGSHGHDRACFQRVSPYR